MKKITSRYFILKMSEYKNEELKESEEVRSLIIKMGGSVSKLEDEVNELYYLLHCFEKAISDTEIKTAYVFTYKRSDQVLKKAAINYFEKFESQLEKFTQDYKQALETFKNKDIE